MRTVLPIAALCVLVGAPPASWLEPGNVVERNGRCFQQPLRCEAHPEAALPQVNCRASKPEHECDCARCWRGRDRQASPAGRQAI